jgi:hypothetical protein
MVMRLGARMSGCRVISEAGIKPRSATTRIGRWTLR